MPPGALVKPPSPKCSRRPKPTRVTPLTVFNIGYIEMYNLGQELQQSTRVPTLYKPHTKKHIVSYRTHSLGIITLIGLLLSGPTIAAQDIVDHQTWVNVTAVGSLESVHPALNNFKYWAELQGRFCLLYTSPSPRD